MPVYSPNKIQVINKSAMKQRGWTDTLLCKHFPTVMTDGIAFLYLLSEVIEKEQSPDFIAQIEKRKARKEKAAAKEVLSLENLAKAKAAVEAWADAVTHQELSEILGREMSCTGVADASEWAKRKFSKEYPYTLNGHYGVHPVSGAANKILRDRYPTAKDLDKKERALERLGRAVRIVLYNPYNRSQACCLLHQLADAGYREKTPLHGVSDAEVQDMLQDAIQDYQQAQIEGVLPASGGPQKVVQLIPASKSTAVQETLSAIKENQQEVG